MQLDFDNKLRKNTPFNIQKVKAAYDVNDHIVGRTLKESLIEVLFIYNLNLMFQIKHGGEVIKEGPTYCDVSFFGSCLEELNTQYENFKKTYSIDENSTLEIAAVLKMERVPYIKSEKEDSFKELQGHVYESYDEILNYRNYYSDRNYMVEENIEPPKMLRSEIESFEIFSSLDDFNMTNIDIKKIKDTLINKYNIKTFS